MEPWHKLVAPVAGLIAGVGLIVVGIVGLAAGGSPAELPNLFLGVLAAGLLGFLLMIPILNKKRSAGKKEAKRATPVVVEEVQQVRKVWAMTGDQACADLRVQDRMGLSHVEAEARYELSGPNDLVTYSEPGYWSFFVKEIYEPAQLLLLCVGVLYLMFGTLEEAITAFLVIFLMATAEVATEWRAKRALNRLGHSSPTEAMVRREGQYMRLDARLLVPGDIVILRVGMEVPADLRVLQSYFLNLDESKLTGESTPVAKDPSQVLSEETSVLERRNIALAGSLVTQGRAVGVVYQTGTLTYLGQVLSLSQKHKEKKTNLQQILKELSWSLSILALILSVLGALVGVWRNMRWQDVILSGLSLAFATIPEELPILIAAVLAVGGQTLSLRLMYVKKLKAVENLGYIDTILTDKTGTLTENQLMWHAAYLGTEHYEIRTAQMSFVRNLDSVGFEKLLEAWLFMSDIGDNLENIKGILQPEASQEDHPSNDDVRTRLAPNLTDTEQKQGQSPHHVDADMFDKAILFGLGSSVCFLGGSPGNGFLAWNPNSKTHLEKVYRAKGEAKFIAETPFNPTVKFASKTFQRTQVLTELTSLDSLNQSAESQVVYVKGAPELLLRHCSHAVDNGTIVNMDKIRSKIQGLIDKEASQGRRLIGYAYQDSQYKGKKSNGNLEEETQPFAVLETAIFLGFLSFLDPVREEAAASVWNCQRAGVKVVMVTGDHIETAIAVAQQVGILSFEEGDTSGMAVSCTDLQLSSQGKEQLEHVVMSTRVFARATPKDKLVILQTLQGFSKCVMATGDGVNDAPILAQADVGVAMGKGTDVAREAASIVVMDDNFSMIPFSLAEGRRLLDNLRKALAFYLGAKVALIVLFILGTLWHRYPLSPIQIILLELFMDLGASSSYVMEPSDGDVMMREPRHPSQRFFDFEMLGGIFVSAISICTTVLTSFAYTASQDKDAAQTSAFFTWLFVQVLMAFNLRTFRQPVIFKGIFSNMGICVWFLATVVLTTLISLFDFLQERLGLVSLSSEQWLYIIVMSLVGTCWIELTKLIYLVVEGKGAGSHPGPRHNNTNDMEIRQSLLAREEMSGNNV